MNILQKVWRIAYWILRVIFILCIAMWTYNLLVDTGWYRWAGLVMLIVLLLPALFGPWVKQKLLAKYSGMKWPLRILTILYLILAVVAFAGFCVGTYLHQIKYETQKTVDFINSQHITLDDVMGNNLPPEPDATQNDATIEGIDANHNYIRDDVELAIFKEYPNSAKIRAAMLQYAKTLQLELIQVSSSDTLIAILQRRADAQACIADTAPHVTLESTHEEIITSTAISDKRVSEVENLALNTDLRRNKEESDDEKYMTTYSIPGNENYCNIDTSLLPN